MKYLSSAMILAAVVLGLGSLSAHGQDEVFRFTPFDVKYHQRVYTIADGMPQSTATSIIQARDGYIWMTTFGGLARYDGLTFKLFTTSNEPGLANNRLTKIYEAPDGVIWIGSEDGDIVKYENGTFRTVYQSPGAPFEKTVTSIVADNSGRLWVGSINGLKWIDIATEQVTPFTEDAAFLSTGRRLSSDISELSVHRDLLYIGTTSGLYRTDLRTPGKLEYIEELDGQNILDFSAIGKDTLLILTGRELVHMDTTSDRLIRRDLSEGSIGHLSSPTDSGTIMIKNGYLYRVTESNIEPPMAGSRFRGNITSVLADNEGNVWIGSDIGLIKLQRRNIWDFSRVRNGVPSSASSIIEGVDGTIFFVSGHRLLKWDNNTVSRIHVANEHLASWRQVIRSLGKDPEGNLFLSGIDNMWKLDQRTLTSTEVFEPAPFDKEVGVIFFDSKGTRWLGSKEAGVQILRANVRTLLNTSNGLAGNSVVRIRESSDGTVWVATRTGLSRIKDGEITNFTTEQGLGSNHVRDIYEEPNGNIWIGTYGGGISRLQEEKIVTLNTVNGLPEDISSAFLEDGQGYLWVMGNRGIYAIELKEMNSVADGNRTTLSSVVYNEKDGMPTAEGNGGDSPSAIKASDGKLWFALIEGVVAIDPTIRPLTRPPIHIESVRLQGKDVPFDGPITIDPGKQDLEISYTGVTFVKPEFLRFQYMLEGFDRQWNEAGTRRTAYFPYLPAGEYIFHVRAANSGVYPSSRASVRLVVLPPFWQTPKAVILYILFGAGLIGLLYYAGFRSIQKKRRKEKEFSRLLISAHEAERKRIAANLHDGLGADLLLIKNWTAMAIKETEGNGPLLERLEDISQKTAEALDETRGISRNLRPLHLDRFGLTATLENMIESVKSSTAININFEIDDIDGIFTNDDELSIFRIVQECINNILKHSYAENAEIKIKNESDQIILNIADDGRGFDKYEIKRLRENASFGLESILHRVETLNGKMYLKTAANSGTTIYISIKKNGQKSKDQSIDN